MVTGSQPARGRGAQGQQLQKESHLGVRPGWGPWSRGDPGKGRTGRDGNETAREDSAWALRPAGTERELGNLLAARPHCWRTRQGQREPESSAFRAWAWKQPVAGMGGGGVEVGEPAWGKAQTEAPGSP